MAGCGVEVPAWCERYKVSRRVVSGARKGGRAGDEVEVGEGRYSSRQMTDVMARNRTTGSEA